MVIKKKVPGRIKIIAESAVKKKASNSRGAKKSTAKKGTVMTSKKTKKPVKKASLIGIDPLAWLNEETSEIDNQEQEKTFYAADESSAMQQALPEKEINKNQPAEVVKDDDPAGTILHLGVALTINEVDDLYADINDRLSRADQVIRIDCSEVEKTDTSGLQLLTVLCRHMAGSGNKIEWIIPSETLVRSAALLGLTTELALSA